MDGIKSGVRYGVARGGSSAIAKTYQGMDASNPPAGWDPFEVWRTRVRDVQQARERAATRDRKR